MPRRLVTPIGKWPRELVTWSGYKRENIATIHAPSFLLWAQAPLTLETQHVRRTFSADPLLVILFIAVIGYGAPLLAGWKGMEFYATLRPASPTFA
jgi:hypothetical protein